MAPSAEEIESEIRDAIQVTIDSGQDQLITVRFIRNMVTQLLDLEEGFFLTEAWKSRSKEYIQTVGAELLDAKEDELAASTEPPKPTKKQAAPLSKAPKRAAGEDKARPTKRRKKEATPPSVDDTSELSEDPEVEKPEDEASDGIDGGDEGTDFNYFSDPPEWTKTKPKTKPKLKAPPKRQAKGKVAESDKDKGGESTDFNYFSDPPELKKTKSKPKPKATQKPKEVPNKRKSKEEVVDSDAASEHTEDDEKPTKKTSKPPEKSKKELPVQLEQSKANVSDKKDDEATVKEEKANESDSTMSIVLDEAPKPKKQRRKPGDSTTSKPSKAAKPAKEKEAKELSPNEALIKTLQSQLAKCGVRKIWAFALKEYGDDSKAKIRHLQDMLKDIGMVGRFSEQRAKEIKELRELQADLEAVTEGEKNWGLEGSRRGAAVRRSLKESSVEEEEKGEDIEDKPKKAARAKQELAFLGDESESD